MTWKPDIQIACAVSRDSFAISIGKSGLSNPFSCILTYDGRLSQPWSRTDIRRQMTSLIASPGHPDYSYIACSDEGDIYYIDDGDPKTVNDKIPNSGVRSAPDALGGIYGLSLTKNALFAVGDNDQILKKSGKADWERLPVTGVEDDTYEAPNYGYVATFDDGTAYVSGSVSGKSKSRTDEQRAEMENPRYQNPDEIDELTEEELELEYERQMKLYFTALPYNVFRFWDGEKWQDELLPKDVNVEDIFVENQKTIWLVGYDGIIYVGNAEDGFRKRSWSDQTPNLHSITKFKDEIILASDCDSG